MSIVTRLSKLEKSPPRDITTMTDYELAEAVCGCESRLGVGNRTPEEILALSDDQLRQEIECLEKELK